MMCIFCQRRYNYKSYF